MNDIFCYELPFVILKRIFCCLSFNLLVIYVTLCKKLQARVINCKFCVFFITIVLNILSQKELFVG